MPYKSLADFFKPISDKQRALNKINEIKALFTDSADAIQAITKNNPYFESVFNKCLNDIDKAEGILNNCDDVASAYDLIASINFNRCILWGRYVEFSQQSENGKQPKSDSLSKFIYEAVVENPGISEKELLRKIQDAEGQGDIQEVTSTEIWFTDKNDNSKSASIGGLKNRLSRAKKKLNSR